MNDSVDVFDRRIQILSRAGYFADLSRKRAALDKLIPTIRLTSDPITRDLYLSTAASVAGISRETIDGELSAERPPADARAGEPAPERARPRDARRFSRRVDPGEAALRAERELVRAMLHRPSNVEMVGERLSPESFMGTAYRRIFAAMIVAGEDATPGDIAADLDEGSIAVLHELMEETGGLERSHELVAGALSAILARDVGRRLTEIDRELPLADGASQDELILEKRRLTQELQGLGRPRWKGFNSPN